jgi:hypothetical protein
MTDKVADLEAFSALFDDDVRPVTPLPRHSRSPPALTRIGGLIDSPFVGISAMFV